jgi:hypothetical protein
MESRRLARSILTLTACLLFASGPAAATDGDRMAVMARPTMHQIFEVVQVLLPLVTDGERFADPAQRETIREQLAALATASDQLDRHTKDGSAGMRSLSGSLTDFVDRAHDQFERGQVEAALRSLTFAMQTCVGCHSRKPSARRFQLAERLTEGDWMKQLSPLSRAHVQVMLRRFDEALATWESVLADPQIAPAILDFSGALDDYLTIAIRGTREYSRAGSALATLSRRGDVPTYLETLLQQWTASLTRLEAEKALPRTLSRARSLIERGRALAPWPNQRGGLVYDLAASSVLNEIADAARERLALHEAPDLDNAQLAEALFLLGAADSRNEGVVWLSQTIDHLAAAIRTEPHGPFAPRAFALLEAEVLGRWGTLRASALPGRVSNLLTELRPLAVSHASGVAS